MTEAEWRKLPMERRLTGVERRRLRQIIRALEFYADPDTYFAISWLPDPPCGDWMRDFEKIDERIRPGKRARKALRITFTDETGVEHE